MTTETTEEYLDVELDKILDDPNIREKPDSDEESDVLGNSLSKYQETPLTLWRDVKLSEFFHVIDGNRRVRAARRKGIKRLKAIIVSGEVIGDELTTRQLRTVVHRKGISDYELFKAVKAIAGSHLDWSRKQLGEHLDIPAPRITQLLTEGIEDVERAFASGAIGLSKRYELAKGKPEQQEALLPSAINGATWQDLAKERTKQDKPDAPKVKAIQIILETGVTVVFKGKNITLANALTAASDAEKEIAKAQKGGHDARTLAALMKKRKKTGAAN